MKFVFKTLFFMVTLISLQSCQKSYRVIEPGRYAFAINEIYEAVVFERNDSLFCKAFRDEYFIHEKKSRSYIVREGRKERIWMNGDTLFMFRTKFIAVEKSLKAKFEGAWYNAEQDITLSSKMMQGDMFWEITVNGIKSAYGAKQEGNSFVTTLKDKVVSFTIEDDCLKDSNGYLYCRI